MTPGGSAEFAQLDFPVADCAQCGRAVLAYVSYDRASGETLCCVHCDLPIVSAARSANGAALDEIGYALVEAGGGCGSGGCGSGACGRLARPDSERH
jgi:hypothetical protein